ncbi:hypothetical protein HMPREF9120_02042 [Neisseria sp. oral taxon 020 str. F0370]|nr:hypothetical protein HMPREF9120_02042 [Neisseria sp. oral taxon 020 str. F0370]
MKHQADFLPRPPAAGLSTFQLETALNLHYIAAETRTAAFRRPLA